MTCDDDFEVFCGVVRQLLGVRQVVANKAAGVLACVPKGLRRVTVLSQCASCAGAAALQHPPRRVCAAASPQDLVAGASSWPWRCSRSTATQTGLRQLAKVVVNDLRDGACEIRLLLRLYRLLVALVELQ